MKRSFATLFVALLLATSLLASQTIGQAPRRCRMAGPYLVFCFSEPFIVDAYSDIETATVFFNSTAPPGGLAGPKWLLATNDQTRRAIVIHGWDYSKGPLPNIGSDGFTAELYRLEADAKLRWKLLDQDQRAGGFYLPVSDGIFGGGTLVVFRTFSRSITPFAGGEVSRATD